MVDRSMKRRRKRVRKRMRREAKGGSGRSMVQEKVIHAEASQ